MKVHEDSMGWDIELAKMFKGIAKGAGDNSGLGAMVGTISKIKPLTINLYSGSIIIQSNIHEIYISDTLKYQKEWGVGHQVLVIADPDNKVFFIVDGISEVR